MDALILKMSDAIARVETKLDTQIEKHEENKKRLDAIDAKMNGNGSRGVLTRLVLIEYAILGLALVVACTNPKAEAWLFKFLGR